jgi:hypothetical protein
MCSHVPAPCLRRVTLRFKGYVNDAACGIKNKTNVECARKCIGKSAKMVLVTDDDKVLTVNNPTALKGHEGQHGAVTGKVTGSSNDVDESMSSEKC